MKDLKPLKKALKAIEIIPFLSLSIFPAAFPFSHLSLILHFGDGRTPEMWSKRVPKLVPLLVLSLSRFWPQNCLKTGPKFNQTHLYLLVTF